MAETRLDSKDHGKVLLEWSFPEVPRYNRGQRWLVGMSAAGVAGIGWAIFDKNFLFGVIVVLALAILFFQSRQEPRQLKARVTEDGIEIGRDYFAYDDIRRFWVIYQPPTIKTLYLSFKTAVRPILPIPLEETDPVKLRRELLRFLEEDLEQENEPVSESVGRLFKM